MSASMDHRIGRPGFAVIPVLDLRGGRVVRARRGERSSYAPIETPLAKGSAPDAVARGLRDAWPAAILYVADLDAIIDRAAPDLRALEAIARTCPGVSLWVDAGFAEPAGVDAFLASGLGRPVIGSESQADADLVTRLGDRAVFSLDTRGAERLGPAALHDDPPLAERGRDRGPLQVEQAGADRRDRGHGAHRGGRLGRTDRVRDVVAVQSDRRLQRVGAGHDLGLRGVPGDGLGVVHVDPVAQHPHGHRAELRARVEVAESEPVGHAARGAGLAGAGGSVHRDDDPGLAKVRTVALGFPEAFEKVSHGRPAFFVSKMFAMYGGSVKPPNKGDDYLQYPQSVMVKVDDSDRRALEQDPRIFYPAYLGPAGWLGLDLAAGKNIDWAEIAELIDASYRLVAPRKLIKQLDGR